MRAYTVFVSTYIITILYITILTVFKETGTIVIHFPFEGSSLTTSLIPRPLRATWETWEGQIERELVGQRSIDFCTKLPSEY